VNPHVNEPEHIKYKSIATIPILNRRNICFHVDANYIGRVEKNE